jgi:sulfatase maturation enzyme AslB (radical SAM superfamily)
MNIKEFIQHPAICTLPWHGICILPNGDIKNCAISQETLGNVHNNELSDIIHAPIAHAIKQDMVNAIRHPRCTTCYRSEDLQSNSPALTKISNRIWYIKVMGNHDLSTYDSVESFKLSILDLRWQNTCNLACVYCGPDLSSKWANELNDKSHVIDLDVFQKTKEYILNNLTDVKHVYLAGGEPLLIKENYELLSALHNINPDVTIRVNTNLSSIDNKIFNLLTTKFKNVKWTVSVDSIEENYEYVRFPGNWLKFKENLKTLQNLSADINFNMVWCILNAYALFDCFDYLKSEGFHDSTFIVQPLYSPSWLSVNHLHSGEIEKIQATILEKLAKSTSVLYSNSLNSMLSYTKIPFEKNINLTRTKLDMLNKRRNLNFSNQLLYLY